MYVFGQTRGSSTCPLLLKASPRRPTRLRLQRIRGSTTFTLHYITYSAQYGCVCHECSTWLHTLKVATTMGPSQYPGRATVRHYCAAAVGYTYACSTGSLCEPPTDRATTLFTVSVCLSVRPAVQTKLMKCNARTRNRLHSRCSWLWTDSSIRRSNI